MADAEIIAVGSEMLTSQRLDTNSLFIADHLNSLGVELRRKLVVGDDRALLSASARDALERVGIVILTGGLGPTEDDLTRDAVADALGRPLVFQQHLSDAIEERFRRRMRKMAEINKRQAYLIEGAEILPNPNGTAVGQWIEHQGRIVILLPGPPGELKPLFVKECVPRLASRLPGQVIRARFYRVTGMTESDLDQLIAPVYSKYTNPTTTILASPGDLQIHLRARCADAEAAEHLLKEVGGPIEELLGDRIFSRNGDSLEAVVGTLLRERSATLTVAESCTGGMVAERLTSVAGSSDYFVGGFLVYSNLMKENLLGIDPALIERHTAVSQEVACAMAEAARSRTGATYAISTTG
jgi:nicotinamide-nucleotide amidase